MHVVPDLGRKLRLDWADGQPQDRHPTRAHSSVRQRTAPSGPLVPHQTFTRTHADRGL